MRLYMKFRIGKKKIKEGSVLIAKCRFCGKVFGDGVYSERKPSVQIITCKGCLDKLPKDDYYGKIMYKH